MVKDAEAHAAEDKKRRELVEAKNHGESLVHSTEKSVAEYGDKVSAEEKRAIETAVESLKTALGGEDIEAIKARTNELLQASMKLGEAMYKASQASAEGGAAPGQGGDAKKDDVIDAEFKEVGEDENKKKSA
jgi:molecular chaperone DnaK